ncbi:MAG TPA: transglycosylase SLT domain-containing protein [Candidatus Hydrogenedens sp.]|nr:transglycosylase SLT domain-containing protein [Candidatus Hydrogenedens sp.]
MTTKCLQLFCAYMFFSLCVFAIDLPDDKDSQIFEHYKQGVFFYEKGDFQSALECFEKASVSSHYTFPFVQIRIAQCKDGMKLTEEGINILEELIKKEPTPTAWKLPAYFFLAKYYEKTNNSPLAGRYYLNIHSDILLPWWMVSLINDGGAFLIKTKEFQKEGSTLLQQVINYGGYNLSRKDSLLNLCLSENEADRAFAIRYLLRSGYLSEAWFIISNQFPKLWLVYTGTVSSVATWKIFEDGGKEFIEQIKNSKDSDYASLIFEYVLRCLVLSKKTSFANQILEKMNYDVPINFDMGEFLYWAGQKSEQNNDKESILFYYKTLLRMFPQHKRISEAVFNLGFWFYSKEDVVNAYAYFEKLITDYPQSFYFARSAYLNGLIYEKNGNKLKAKEYFKKALQGKLGDYYVHRSADKLLKDYHESIAHQKIAPLKHLPVSSLIVDKQISHDIDTITKILNKNTELKWLNYFAEIGVEEKEWIAFDICKRAQNGEIELDTLPLLSHLGTAQVVWDYYYSQCFTTKKEMINKSNEWQILFPMPYYQSVLHWSKKVDVNPFLIWSIMKQESSYRTSVISTSNARGLLQLIPSTAKWIANKDDRLKGIDYFLWKYPEYNIALGSVYFRYLLDRFNGNVVYAIAGYNAGPGRVDEWKRNIKDNDLETFIENIPFKETRNYVKKVLGNYAGYHSIYKGF